MKIILTVVAAVMLMGLGSAIAQDQSASPAAPQSEEAGTPPKADKPVKRTVVAHTRKPRPGEWYDWYYWPWNFLPANLPHDSHRNH
jgi:hypothetical protein